MKRTNATVALGGHAAQSGRSRIHRSGLSTRPEHDLRLRTICDFWTMRPSDMRATSGMAVDLMRKLVDNWGMDELKPPGPSRCEADSETFLQPPEEAASHDPEVLRAALIR